VKGMSDNFSLNLEMVPKELQLILEVINLEKSELEGKRVLENDYDWKLFIQLANHHRIFSYIYPKLKEIEWIPSKVLQALYQQYKKNTFKMLQLCGEMEYISQEFNKNEIPLLFLKGPVLAKSLYGDISLRTSCDIDVLILIENLDKAEANLLSLGYVKDDYIETVLNDWKWRHHHITFFHPGKGIKFELHWRLNPGPGKEPGFKELWSRRRISTITRTTPICYLGAEDLFLFLVSHGARHGWSRLRWLLDIKKLMAEELDGGKLISLLKRYHFQYLGGQALILTSMLLNNSIPSELLKLTSGKKPTQLAQNTIFYLERMVNLHTEPLPEEISVYHSQYLFSLKSFQQRLLFFLSFLHPYPMDAQVLPLPRALHFLYFPLRPFLWILRQKRKDVLS
jgi:hypothetical protein